MEKPSRYSINLDARFAPLELVDVQKLVEACHEPWYNQTLCRVNDCVVLTPRQGLTVPKGVLHRTSAPERTVILMFEGAEVMPAGDA